LQVTDSTGGAVASSAVKVTVNTALTAPAAPTVSATNLDANQGLIVTGTIPTTGSSPYAWTWLVSVNGRSYVVSTFCAIKNGTGASAGTTATCSIPANYLTAGDTYAFELRVTDSATLAETQTSSASSTVRVASALTAPGAPSVSSTSLVVSRTLTVTGTMPSTGTAPYSWQWLVSVNGGAFVPTTQCTVNSGAGAAAGSTISCTIAGNTLKVGDTYSFELKVTDSATTSETQTSLASSKVTVIS